MCALGQLTCRLRPQVLSNDLNDAKSKIEKMQKAAAEAKEKKAASMAASVPNSRQVSPPLRNRRRRRRLLPSSGITAGEDLEAVEAGARAEVGNSVDAASAVKEDLEAEEREGVAAASAEEAASAVAGEGGAEGAAAVLVRAAVVASAEEGVADSATMQGAKEMS